HGRSRPRGCRAGGGAAGLTASINAKSHGAESVILLEKMPFCGGSTALSGGAMTRPAIEGDPEGTMTAEEMYEYYKGMASPQVEDDMLHLYIDESPDVWRWFTSLEGGETTHMFHNTPENVYTTYPDGQGQGVTNVLENEALKNGVDIRTSHNVLSLLTDENGTIAGVKCTNADGAEQSFYAKSVIIATGGFANDKDMLTRFGGTNAGTYVVRKGAGGANGDGIRMAEEVGAKLVFGDNWDTSGQNTDWIPYRPAGFTMSLFYSSQRYGIMVNDEGNRFVNENLMLPRIYEEMVNQINAGHFTFHAIETLEGFEAAGATAEDIAQAVEAGAVSKYDTIEEVAAAIGVPAENLQATIAAYVNDETDAMGKEDHCTNLLNPDGPFYVGETKPQRSGTMGGIAINTKSEVLDQNGQPIPNLYAAGETANGTFFGNYYYICGNMIMHAMVTGQEAGISAAENLN
ncbi:MAG TPA: FAD-dependent oxidoreductase, partial [Clostridia bacterium]|nr:FAD-dependent oxidoreductase [Clostridia bacterium]